MADSYVYINPTCHSRNVKDNNMNFRTKNILTFFAFLIFTCNILAQIELADSIKDALQGHPKVNSVKYETILFQNGQIMMEGWLYESNYPGINYQERKSGTFSIRVGTWRRYDKKGNIRRIENIPLYDSVLTSVDFFNKKKRLKRRELYYDSADHPGHTKNKNFKGQWNPWKNNYRWIQYYNNGGIKFDINYCGLKLCRDYREYHSNGQLRTIYHYIEPGIKNGDYELYYEDGTLKTIGQYVRGQKSSVWKFYNKKGNLKREKNYSL